MLRFSARLAPALHPFANPKESQPADIIQLFLGRLGGCIHPKKQYLLVGRSYEYEGIPVMTDDFNKTDTIELTVDVIAAYVSNNPVPVSELPSLIAQVHQSLAGLSTASETTPLEKLTPAVPIKKSVTPEYIVCLDDGKKFKSLKRHLKTTFGITPEEYRAKWNLPVDYPMVAPDYAAARSELAKKMGLGRKPKAAEPVRRTRRAA
jgi:predicted transcriptional regulator